MEPAQRLSEGELESKLIGNIADLARSIRFYRVIIETFSIL